MEPIKLQYKTVGSGSPLVLIPGGLTGWISWDPFVADFSDSFNVIQVQLLSVQYGLENKSLPDNYSVKMESRALAESLNEIGITTPADFIGWSFGGFVLLDFALDHPEMVKSLTLIEPPALWILKASGNIDPETKRMMEFLETLSGDISEDQLEEFMIFAGFAPNGTDLRKFPQWENWVKHRQSLRNSKHVVEHEDDINKLKNFNSPVMLIKGTGSAAFLHNIIECLEQDLPNVKITELDGGHSPHIVSKDEFLKLTKGFISDT